jgi:Protein of unknown function (DUF3277)
MFTYSYSAIQLSLSHPISGSYIANGEAANGGITIAPVVDHTVQEVTPDGATITNFIPGNNATMTIQAQQIANLDDYLIGWHNDCVTAASLGDMATYAAMTAVVIDTNSGKVHTMQGIAPSKIPDTPYGAQSAMLSWVLKVSNLVTE